MEKIEEIQQFIENHVSMIKPALKKVRLAYWNAAISGKQKDYEDYEQLQKEIERVYNNKENFEKVKNFLNSEIKNQLIRRQVKLLYLSYLSSQGDIKLIEKIVSLSTLLEQKFNTFRAEMNEKKFTDNEIKKILREETDPKKLQEAWESSKKQGEIVEKELIELVKLRNMLAREIGFNNYYELSLEASEQTTEGIRNIFNEMANLTDFQFTKLKQEIDEHLSKKHLISKEALKPWHYQDLFFQEGPNISKINLDNYYNKNILDISKRFFSSINLPVEDILERSDLYEKEGKYQHACCTDIDREGDVRIIENIKNNEKWMETTLHELGHAVYSKFTSQQLPFLLRTDAHTLVTEAIALLFGRQSKNLSFIKNYAETKEISPSLSDEINNSLRLRQLVFCRWSQVMFHFEKALYENPEQDLNSLWWQLAKKYQRINFTRDKPDWASKIHFVSSPVYYHNYLLGELLASQIHNHIVKNILQTNSSKNADYSNNKDIGKFLKENIFSIGKEYGWEELIELSTGKPLDTSYYIEEFVNS